MLLGTFTAVESALDAVLDIIEAAEPVRRRDAANRGRDAVDAAEDVGLRLMRAASWLRDGMRAPGGGLSGFGASGAGGASAADIVQDSELVEDHDVETKGVSTKARITSPDRKTPRTFPQSATNYLSRRCGHVGHEVAGCIAFILVNFSLAGCGDCRFVICSYARQSLRQFHA